MARRKEEPEEQEPEVRTDASGRELFPWEVDPADQVRRRPADDTEEEANDGGPAQPSPGPDDNVVE